MNKQNQSSQVAFCLKSAFFTMLILVSSCQNSKSHNSEGAQVKSVRSINCQDAEQAKQTLYAIKGDIKNFAKVANCYNQMGQRKVARLFYQKSIDENQDVYESMLGLAKINDLDNLPLQAKKNYETISNQIAQFSQDRSKFYFDYALFTLYYRDSRASAIVARKFKASNSIDEMNVIKAYQQVITGNFESALETWKAIKWSKVQVNAYRAFHIAHLAKLLNDDSRMKSMVEKFDLTIPNTKRIFN